MPFSKAGIVAMEYALPKHYISAKEFADNGLCEQSKLEVGLGVKENGVLGKEESVFTLALEALDRLLEVTGIDENDICRLEVGSETNPDSAKSIKTTLMQRFTRNKDMVGVDNVQACYGGVAAMLNSIAWLESSFCKGKYAIVVCVDAFFYEDPNLFPLSSAGAVAILIGFDPIFAIDYNIKSFFENHYDFLKPKYEHPVTKIQGKESINVYVSSYENCVQENECDFRVFHIPYPKILKKLKNVEVDEKIQLTLTAAERNGNTYTASIFFSLISLISNIPIKVNQTISMFSFGSGSSASYFILKKVKKGMETFNLSERLDKREFISYENYKKLVENYFNK